MNNKILLRILVLSVLLAMVFLSAKVITEASAPVRPAEKTISDQRLAGSDWIERHPPVDIYAGSDWIERHPVPTHDADYYVGSDWIERHPSTPAVDIYAGSDWIQRHPGNGKP